MSHTIQHCTISYSNCWLVMTQMRFTSEFMLCSKGLFRVVNIRLNNFTYFLTLTSIRFFELLLDVIQNWILAIPMNGAQPKNKNDAIFIEKFFRTKLCSDGQTATIEWNSRAMATYPWNSFHSQTRHFLPSTP